ncbi:MAG: hypothetical protein HN366_29210, partial [Deltaproteobacteria bacterium]|nr:hypothetical protein [Deltaproteobacteria bacterium]
ESDIPKENLEKEEEFAREDLKKEGKPEAMWDKIIPGKLKKYAKENTLANQMFVKDDKKTVNQNFFEAVGEGINYISFEDIDLISDLDKKFGRAILKIGKIDQNTHISCGETQIFDNLSINSTEITHNGIFGTIKNMDERTKSIQVLIVAYYDEQIVSYGLSQSYDQIKENKTFDFGYWMLPE